MPWYGPSPRGTGGGSGFSIKGSRDSADQLPTTGELGDAYIVQDTGHLWVWDGDEFIDAGRITGPAGATGAAGATPTLVTGQVSDLAWGQPAEAKVVDIGDNTYRLDLALPIGRPGNDGQPRYTGHGEPGTILGSAPGDLYLDLDTYNLYQLG